MKKLNDANIGILVLLSTCLCLFSCNNDNDNLPKDYAGFEHSKETVECEGNKSECELEIKIVAMEKAKEDRTVVLAAPPPVTGQAAVIQLTEKKPKEGTILTVAKGISDKAAEIASQTDDIEEAECHFILHSPMERRRNQQTDHSVETKIMDQE